MKTMINWMMIDLPKMINIKRYIEIKDQIIRGKIEIEMIMDKINSIIKNMIIIEEENRIKIKEEIGIIKKTRNKKILMNIGQKNKQKKERQRTRFLKGFLYPMNLQEKRVQ